MSEDFKSSDNTFFKNLFNHFDSNQDGYLDEKEFKELSLFYADSNEKDNTINREITNQFDFLSDWELNEDFNKMDVDNDGKISYQGILFKMSFFFLTFYFQQINLILEFISYIN